MGCGERMLLLLLLLGSHGDGEEAAAGAGKEVAKLSEIGRAHV